MSKDSPAALASVVREQSSEILAAWLARFERSQLRFRRATAAARHTAQVANLVEALQVAAAHGSVWEPGDVSVRELERSSAFLGAQFAAEGATGFDVAALLVELREVIAALAPADAPALGRLFEWLTVVALDTFAASGLQSLREQQAEQLEAGTPVVELFPKVPAVLFVGAPSTAILESLLSRAWLLAVGTGAPCLILDVAGLTEQAERNFAPAYRSFLDQATGSTLQVLMSGARRPMREQAATDSQARGLTFQHFDRFDSAVGHALERAGYTIRQRQA
ncbi:MAG TPA: hypothetical protein VGM88_26690 [Kofleriaceae bacterium]